MDIFLKYFIIFLVIYLGTLLIVGVYKKLDFLIDPPIEWSPWYSQSFLKKLFGKEFVYWETLIFGVALVFSGIFLFYKNF